MSHELEDSILPEMGVNFYQFEMSNGFKVIYYQRLDVPFITLLFGFSIEDTITTKSQGLAHIAEHLIVRYLEKQLENWGNKFKVQDARTNMDSVKILCSVVSEAVTDVLRALHIVFKPEPCFLADRELFQREMKAILEELDEVNQDTSKYIKIKVRELLFQGTAYGIGNPGGQISNVEIMTLDHLISYFQNIFKPAGSVLVITGSFGDSSELFKTVCTCLEIQ
jgi:predicted Zn-dependent peptidase